MKTVAKLDAMGIYRGIDEIEDDALTDQHVEVPADCDLAPGRYRWNGTTFVPLPSDNPMSDAPPVPALTAIAVGLIAVKESGVPLPAATLGWLDAYLMSVDVLDTEPLRTESVKAYLRDRGLRR